MKIWCRTKVTIVLQNATYMNLLLLFVSIIHFLCMMILERFSCRHFNLEWFGFKLRTRLIINKVLYMSPTFKIFFSDNQQKHCCVQKGKNPSQKSSLCLLKSFFNSSTLFIFSRSAYYRDLQMRLRCRSVNKSWTAGAKWDCAPAVNHSESCRRNITSRIENCSSFPFKITPVSTAKHTKILDLVAIMNLWFLCVFF